MSNGNSNHGFVLYGNSNHGFVLYGNSNHGFVLYGNSNHGFVLYGNLSNYGYCRFITAHAMDEGEIIKDRPKGAHMVKLVDRGFVSGR